jgi:transcriptional regulator of NAD metabolism
MFILEQELHEESNICIRTEASTPVPATVVESSAQVDSPPTLKSQLASENASPSLESVAKHKANVSDNVLELSQ